MRIDSSGNLLVGTTDGTLYDNTTGSGFAVTSAGRIYNAVTSNSAQILNRMSSDGDIVQFRKDGTTVGSIAAKSGEMYLGSANTGVRFYDAGDAITPFDVTGATGRDNAIDIGVSSTRFKDLYLSGGVYLGGTGSANHLDDYEEGTWTPTLRFNQNASGITYSTQDGQYTKIGNMVYINGIILLTSKGSNTGAATIAGLPFSTGDYLTGTSHENAIVWNYWSDYTDTADPSPRMYISGSTIILWSHLGGTNATNADFSNVTSMRFSGWYMAS